MKKSTKDTRKSKSRSTTSGMRSKKSRSSKRKRSKKSGVRSRLPTKRKLVRLKLLQHARLSTEKNCKSTKNNTREELINSTEEKTTSTSKRSWLKKPREISRSEKVDLPTGLETTTKMWSTIGKRPSRPAPKTARNKFHPSGSTCKQTSTVAPKMFIKSSKPSREINSQEPQATIAHAIKVAAVLFLYRLQMANKSACVKTAKTLKI